ncbi:MAG TPA: polysaccharide deacetylase family protein [Terriglobia bacterium]|nr:polysaccharide deacetylase family protein [Terriglobia bacterium]
MMNRRSAIKLAGAATLGASLVPKSSALLGQESRSSPVYVVLWFDTEDYILPQADDAAKRIAEFLTRQGVRATFKVVGEKGRTLERRNRRDVIAALAQHEIGYHSNTHSQHPTVAEYESGLGWEAGVEEFARRERPGFDDLRRIFGKDPTCYGQPGNSWAPQPYGALRKWGVRVYLDEAAHVGLNGKPFWYGGLLNIFNTREGPSLRPNDDWTNVEEAKARFQGFYEQFSSQPGGGIVSLYFHPCEFIHREFWDAVNFAHGLNPPRAEWKLPPMKAPEDAERAFRYLEQLVVRMKSFPRVQFVTASEALGLFPDAAQNRPFSTQELGGIARRIDAQVTFQTFEDFSVAPSEALALLNQLVSGVARKKAPGAIRLESTPDGPDSSAAGLTSPIEVPWSQFSRTTLDVADFLAKTNQVPSQVWFGSTAVTPESYLVALAQAVNRLLVKAEPPESVTLAPASLVSAPYVAHDSPSLWGWPIFPPGFHSPQLMELARLQAWTLKPARLPGTR